jgi:hypothetical protein
MMQHLFLSKCKNIISGTNKIYHVTSKTSIKQDLNTFYKIMAKVCVLLVVMVFSMTLNDQYCQP